MAHFTYIENNIVQRVHVLNNNVIFDENGIEKESLGQDFLSNLYGGNKENYIQCSFNANFRGKYPAIGDIYDSNLNEFITSN